MVHLLLFALFTLPSISISPETPIFLVSIEPPAISERPPPTRQIVSEPDSMETSQPVSSSLLSEKSRRAEKETIQRGDDPQAGAAVAQKSLIAKQETQIQKQSAQKKTSNQRHSTALKQKENQTAPPKLSQLALDSQTLQKSFAVPQSEKQPLREEVSPQETRPFSRPSGSGAAFLGRTGVSDFIPSLPDGDLTLLNTKADQYAVFVRRVATQVFGLLRSSGWETLRASDIQKISKETLLRAVLSPDGKLLRVELLESSGNSRFDDTVIAAAKQGAKDPNPPPGARADDGTIRFLFKSRTWVRYAAASRNGAPIERRWLLLGTGLE